MAKPTAASKKRKQQASKSNASPANKKANTAQPPATTDLETVPLEHDTSDLIGDLLLPEEVESTIDVLQMVSKNPEVLKLKELKGLKGACFEAMRMIKEVSGEGTSLTSRVSTALQNGLHLESLILLTELRYRSISPKLGSLQRWVRECDAAAISTAQTKKLSAEEEAKEEAMVWEVLDAVLRACTSVVPEGKEGERGVVEKDVERGGKGVRRWKEWDVREKVGASGKGKERVERNFWKEVEEGKLVSQSTRDLYTSHVTALDTVPGPSRRPPNLFPAIVQHVRPSPTSSSVLALASSHTFADVQRFEVPGVPGALLLTDVLTRDECVDIIGMAETVGLIEDKPVGGSAAQLNSILAHNLILLAPPQLIEPLFARVQAHLPSHVPVSPGSTASGELKGINRRFRIYRYKEGSVYRPHVDGAWPSSAETPASEDGLTPATYVYDAEPTQYSRFTFLLYLNDSFTNGCTTFYLPDPNRPGVLDARPVRPLSGSALVFPHGATHSSLLHEGSPVFPNELEGAKYVIRTEVLYEVDRIASAGEGGIIGGLV